MSTADNFQTLAVNQRPGTGTNYPFAMPGTDVIYLLGDLWLGYRPLNVSVALPLKITWMYGFGSANNSNPTSHTPSHTQDIVISDNAGNIVFDSTAAATFTATPWGLNLITLCWTGSRGVLRATRHTSPPSWAGSLTQYKYIVPVDGTLDARTYEQLPDTVTSLKIGTQTLTGNIQFSQGWNINLSPTAVSLTNSGARATSSLLIRAQPGDGLGLPPGCSETPTAILRVNEIEPTTDGTFTLDFSGCYRLQKPVSITATYPFRTAAARYDATTSQAAAVSRLTGNGYTLNAAKTAVADSTLTASNDCKPCCTCDDYVNTYRGLVRVDSIYRSLARTAENSRDQHQRNIDRWNTSLACRQASSVRLITQGEPKQQLYVAGAYCNMTACCMNDVTIRLTVQATGTAVVSESLTDPNAVKCRESYRAGSDTQQIETPFVPVGPWPIFDIHFASIKPGSTARFRTRLQLSVNGTATVTASVHAGSLTCPAGINDPGMPTATVPSGVSAIWTENGRAAPYAAVAYVQQSSPVGLNQGCLGCE